MCSVMMGSTLTQMLQSIKTMMTTCQITDKAFWKITNYKKYIQNLNQTAWTVFINMNLEFRYGIIKGDINICIKKTKRKLQGESYRLVKHIGSAQVK